MKLLFCKKTRSKKATGKDCSICMCESQIAEAFFRKYSPTGYITVSGGTRPAGEINLNANTIDVKSIVVLTPIVRKHLTND